MNRPLSSPGTRNSISLAQQQQQQQQQQQPLVASPHHKQVDFVSTTAPPLGSQSPTEQKIIGALQKLQNLVNQEVKWRGRVISSVQTCSNIDLSAEKMNEYINQCKARIAGLRDEAAKLADKQLHLVSFEPSVYKQWFEQVGSDPLTVTPPPTVAASCSQALLFSNQAVERSSKSSGAAGSAPLGGAAPKKSTGGGAGGRGGANAALQAQQQYLDGIPLPEKFWKRRDQQRQALANVYLSIFDLARLNREKAGSKPTSAAEMVYQLQEATRLSATGPQQLRDLLREYRAKERDVAAGIFNAMISSNSLLLNDANSSKLDPKTVAKLRQQQQQQQQQQQKQQVAGGNTSGRGRPPSGSARAGKTGADADASGEPITVKSCLQTGVFIHDPQVDDLALSTELRPGDFFDIGSPRCLDQRALHRVMTLRSRRLRLEECIAVFEEEKLQLSRRQNLQKEMTGLSQYALFATKPEIERTIADEKSLQKRKQEEAEAQRLAEKHGLLRRSGAGAAGAKGQSGNAHDENDNTLSFEKSFLDGSGTLEKTQNGIESRTTSANVSPSFAISRRR